MQLVSVVASSMLLSHVCWHQLGGWLVSLCHKSVKQVHYSELVLFWKVQCHAHETKPRVNSDILGIYLPR